MSKTVRVRNVEIGQGRPKICAMIIGDTREEILELAKISNSADCDLVEFRADYYQDILDPDKAESLLDELRSTVKKPIIFTFRRSEEGGRVAVPLSYYKKLLRMVAEKAYAEILDVEMSVATDDGSLVPDLKSMGSVIILSLHNFNSTPTQSEIIKIFRNMEMMGADIIKAAFMPGSKKDVLTLVNAAEEISGSYTGCPVVAISMGYLGMITRILGEFIDSAISFASITRASVPGQVNVDSLRMILDVIHDNFKRVFLVGFMGTGKTAVANQLAYKYGLSRIDLDAYIEQKEHSIITEIYNSSGPEVFRSKETKYLRKLINQDYRVITLGSGALMQNENVELVKDKGIIVLLTARPESIIERIKNDRTRPLVGENMDLDYISGLIREREEKYRACADVIISTDDKTIDEICKEIVESLGFTL
ncbi:MAG: type I 3-dehydroquinate dehydratase [Parasporobacterium sp.]|nr:type I 3-dehydroquinate dehydratase [Parasporobacterium sp.]